MKEHAAPNKTLCDYDSEPPADLQQRLDAVKDLLGIHPLTVRMDQTARGFHLVIVWNRRFSPAEIVAIQAILGSDPMRETLNLARARAASKGQARLYWNILYAEKITL